MTFKRRNTQGENTTSVNYRNGSVCSSIENELTVVIDGEKSEQSVIFPHLARINNRNTVDSIEEAKGSKTSNTMGCQLRTILLISGVIVIAILLVTLMIWLLTPEIKKKPSDWIDLVERLKNIQLDVKVPKEQWFWHRKAYDALYQRLVYSSQHNGLDKWPQNVILFVGDGMGPNSVTAARIYGKGEENLLRWEKFPDMGLLKTYCFNKLVPDSFSTATALFGGTKTNYETGGVDAGVNLANCSASLEQNRRVSSLLAWAQEVGMKTGFVTTTRVTHATPAALYAHSADRRWECESKMPPSAKLDGCKDIARQLIEDEVGQRLNVIMGGGRQMLISNVSGTAVDPIDKWACQSHDGRNLLLEWENRKKSLGQKGIIVENRMELSEIGYKEDIDFVLGIFANGHLKYDYERDESTPSLEEMTVNAINVLSKRNNDKGFVLMVEGGLIDQAHHRGTAKRAINEVLALERAVVGAIKFLEKANLLHETLIVVTADHSHTLSINGYPERGSSIFGLAGTSRTEQTPYTILTYGTTYNGFQAEKVSGRRRNPKEDNLEDWLYTQQGAINTDENTHGGSDVTVHALGPLSHLFGGVHEQSYVAHALAFALRIGRFMEEKGYK